MGRKQFLSDLAIVAQHPPAHIDNAHMTEDGEISFEYIYNSDGQLQKLPLRLLALSIDSYPEDNEYIIFAADGDVSSSTARTFELVTSLVKNKTVQETLAELASALWLASTSGQLSNPIVLLGTDDEGSLFSSTAAKQTFSKNPSNSKDGVADESDGGKDDDDSCSSWADGDSEDDFGFDELDKPKTIGIGRNRFDHFTPDDNSRMKMDLREAKDAGFKVGCVEDSATTGIICISIRVSKLGISEEAMKAWTVKPQQYFVILIRCLRGYTALETLKKQPTLSGSTEIRVGICSNYKPNSRSAQNAYSSSPEDAPEKASTKITLLADDLQPLFIGGPLQELFATRFTGILRFRDAHALTWASAEKLVHTMQGAIIDEELISACAETKDSDVNRALPQIVMEDALSERPLRSCSMPLVTMQFALRHFVRCTEFCLVCHCSSGSTFEALKPYVCSDPLCLYQYLSLGFGPSIEWEILTQPYVVDLLISFCWIQAKVGKLKNFPVGINLNVPMLPENWPAAPKLPKSYSYQRHGLPPRVQPSPSSPLSQTETKFLAVLYNAVKQELLFTDSTAPPNYPLKAGDFVALISTKYTFCGIVYHRIDEVILPCIRLGPPIVVISDSAAAGVLLPDRSIEVDCYPFCQSFDDLSDDKKGKSIVTLLDTLPPVKEMVSFLKTQGSGQDISLSSWKERISKPALNVLRWIIASNRSFIMQVDTVANEVDVGETTSIENRVTGMRDFMQFRFAQGAPDKEQRFTDCIKQEFPPDTQFTTFFAWHGSSLCNWHSIIREGLHFRFKAHGRAFGDGVYMSNDANTSLGYSGRGAQHHQYGNKFWHNSELKMTSVMSLNEVVNRPDHFVSHHTHYVVNKLDWIQTRYLFVQTNAKYSTKSPTTVQVFPQDPKRQLVGIDHVAADIPITAIARSRRPKQQTKSQETKKRKSGGSGQFNEPVVIDDDAESIATASEDREYLLDDESHSGYTPILLDSDTDLAELSDLESTGNRKKRARCSEETRPSLQLIGGCLLDSEQTDFVPGSLDTSIIRTLPPPDDTSRAASNSLMKAFGLLTQVQAATPAHELGWYVDPEAMGNMYQWIVELHSFDASIPLACDMKDARVTSIVIEMRFTNQFPFAPPFVRVVKPRFLPFHHGGGGHVTEGGAICMELLTNTGWSAASSIENVLLQVRLAMSSPDPPARLATNHGHAGGQSRGNETYGSREAIEAYKRACRTHGWEIPPSFLLL